MRVCPSAIRSMARPRKRSTETTRAGDLVDVNEVDDVFVVNIDVCLGGSLQLYVIPTAVEESLTSREHPALRRSE